MNLNSEIDISLSIRKLLKTKNISQKEIAEKIGFSVPAFNKALKRNDFKISTLEKICNVLGVHPLIFFEDFGTGGADDFDMLFLPKNELDKIRKENKTIKRKKEKIESMKELITSLKSENSTLKEIIEILKKNNPTIV